MSLIAASTMFLCTMTTVGVFLVTNFKQSVEAEQARLQSITSVFGAVLSKPLAAGDQAAARNALRALRDMPFILQTSVHNARSELVAEMGGGAVLERTVLRSDKVTMIDLFSIETLEIKKPIINGGADVGTLTITADISWMVDLFWNRFLAAAIFATGAIAVGFLLGQRLVKRATRRLSELAGALAGIGNTETLRYSFTRETDDEVGVLIDAVNDMMGRIDERDRSLRAHSDNLEDTVQKRTAELVSARDEAERANAAKSEFLSMMSHEIRTPMNGMMVMAQMLAAAPLSPRHLRFAEIINRSGQNLLSIINDVLDISKIESGKLVMEAAPFALDQLFADVYGLFAERARERGVYLGYSVDPSVPLVLTGDATRLNQVITNLVNNALKFTEKGSVILRATATATEAGHAVAISVTDTGIGIAKDKLALVFERFAQADQSITRRFGGTGLGLAISKRLVESMDGSISVSSVEGKGSVFTATVVLGAEAEEGQPASLRGTMAYIKCANPMQKQLLAQTLEKFGAQIAIKPADASLVLTDEETYRAGQGQISLFLVPALEVAETSYRTRARLEMAVPVSRETISQLAASVASGDFSEFKNINRSMEQTRHTEEFRGLRALAVDDNMVNREVLSEALTSMMIHVDTAANGEEALVQTAKNTYDIIFMDCSMPVMDGFTATRIFRERESNGMRRTPVVAITALSEGAGERNWRKNGMDGWISKPFTIPAIAGRIKALVFKQDAGDADLIDQTAMLDEPTITMIVRLSSRQGDGSAKRIHQLFTAGANSALQAMDEASRASDIGRYSEAARNLATVSKSAGASRLALAAEAIGAATRSDAHDQAQDLAKLHTLLQQTNRDMQSRLGLAFSADTKAA
ncbi:MAG: ATP-binding protein [Rhizobiaceae bacterium]